MNIPEKFYVARCFRGTDQVLGFMVVADKEHTKAFQKKKEAADRWARGTNTMEGIYVDNKPTSGFSIVTNVSRYSTSNVVWRICHPEGFEFEITSTNMCDLLANNTLINGVFQDEMFFNESRELLNAKTAIFSKMQEKQEEKQTLKEFADSLEPGMGIGYNTVSSYEDKPPAYNEYVYLGKFAAICLNKNKEFAIPEKSSSFHVVQSISTGQFYLRNKMDNIELVRRPAQDITVDRGGVVNAVMAQINAPKVPGRRDYLDQYYEPICISEKGFKLSDLTVEYNEVPMDTLQEFVPYKLYHVTDKGKDYRVFLGLQTEKNRGYHFSEDYNMLYNLRGKTLNYLCAYGATVQDNGSLVLDDGIDLNEHKTFARYHYSSPFYPPFKNYSEHSGYKGVRTARLAVTETIRVGVYKLGK